MANTGKRERGSFDTINHYDSKGKKIGRSEPSLFGSCLRRDKK